RNPESHAVWEVSAAEGDVVLFGQHLKASGAGKFVFSAALEVAFASQGGGGMRMTVTSRDAAPQIFDRLLGYKPSPEELAEFAGTYESSELAATYRFAVKVGKLTETIGWQEPGALEASQKDEFHGGPTGASFVFRRDAQGRVTAVDVFAG